MTFEYKIYPLLRAMCHVSIGMGKQKRMNMNSVITSEQCNLTHKILSHKNADTTLIILIAENETNDNCNTTNI